MHTAFVHCQSLCKFLANIVLFIWYGATQWWEQCNLYVEVILCSRPSAQENQLAWCHLVKCDVNQYGSVVVAGSMMRYMSFLLPQPGLECILQFHRVLGSVSFDLLTFPCPSHDGCCPSNGYTTVSAPSSQCASTLIRT